MSIEVESIKTKMNKHKSKVTKAKKGGSTLIVKKDSILGVNDAFKILDLYFNQKDIMYSHLHNSFDQFLDDSVRSLLKNGKNVFMEKITKDKIYKYKFVYNNIAIKPPSLESKDKIMFPADARTLDLTYSSKLVATITQVQETTDIATGKVSSRVIDDPEIEYPIATIPIMIKSKYCSLNIKKDHNQKECNYDPGGYFIVNGSEKVIMSLERKVFNKPLVFTKKDASSLIYKVEVNSKSYDDTEMMQMVSINMRDKDKNMTIKVPIIKEIPIFILFRALGVESDKDIINMCVYDSNDSDMINLLRVSLDDSVIENTDTKIRTKESAIDYLINKMRVIKKYSETNKDVRLKEKKMHLEHLLKTNLLPHTENKPIVKAYFLGYMINRLMQVFLGRIPLDDRDSYVNKRVDLPGSLMFELFKQYYKKMLNECNKFFKKRNTDDEKPLNIINQIKASTIEQGLKASLSKGVWGKKVGVSQKLERKSFVHALSSLRRVVSLTGDVSHNKLTGPRYLHNTSVGFVCYIETPEGAKIGLQKSLALTTNITVMLKSQVYIIKDFLKDKISYLEDIKYGDLKTYTKVFLNYEWVGMTKEPRKLYNLLKKQKLSGSFSNTTSIIHELKSDIESKELYINCDGGRFYRPLLRVNNNRLLCEKKHVNTISVGGQKSATVSTTWNQFMLKNQDLVEYIDIDENTNSMLAMFPIDIEKMRFRMEESVKLISKIKIKDNHALINRYDDFMFVRYTHCEIHPSMMIGLVVSNIPFCNHNQAPRNIFQFSQAKSAMGIYAANFRERLDIAYQLYNLQRPLITTRPMKYINTDKLPAGENCIVAIACYTGSNQEDSVIINQSAIDRGFMRATIFKTWKTVISKNQSTSQDDVFTKPDISKVIGIKGGTYEKLNDDGYAPEETIINKGDIIIGKVTPIQPTGANNKTFKDNSEVYKEVVSGTVDRVWKDIYNNEGYEMRKMRIRSERVPIIGDKMCCYDQSHEVLTTNGWIRIDKLTKKHKVASLDNGVMKYTKVKELQEYNYKGKMYVVESSQVSLKVTPNHRMYISEKDKSNKYKILKAEELYGKRVKYLKSCDSFEQNINKKDLPKELGLDDSNNIKYFVIHDKHGEVKSKYNLKDWLVIFGIWLANGSIDNNKTVSFAANKQQAKDALVKACTNLNIRLGIYSDKKEYNINSVDIIRTFNHQTETNKYIPEWVWCLSSEQCKILIDSMILGDGYYMKGTTTIRFDTSSVKLRDDFQRLAFHAGYSANYYLKSKAGDNHPIYSANGKKFDTPKEIVSTADSWRLTLISTQNKPLVNKKSDGANQLDKWEDFDGKVYCCTVPGDGIIYVRRNGMPVWCGNSRSGQKGTIGITLPASDMPFTKDGIRPDIIMNPNAIPSRMTIGQLIECLIGKVSAIEGYESDATPFNYPDIEAIKDALEKNGFERNGTEYLYNGFTGKKMKVMIFIGPTYYQRLTHMVNQKIHSRARGPTTILTRSAPEGRARDGGLRFGEMEKDAMVAHGAARFLKERFMETADAYETYVCNICGMFAQRMLKRDSKPYETKQDTYWCSGCKNRTKVSRVRIPYAFKLFLQELQAMSIAPRLKFKENEFDHTLDE